MASVSSLCKLAFAVIVCMAVAAPLAEAAITCGNVKAGLAPCVRYLKGSGPVTPACCNGVRTLKGMAKTPTDRRTACGCLKSAASSISGIKLPNAAALPGKCGVSIAYAISPKTDCSKVN